MDKIWRESFPKEFQRISRYRTAHPDLEEMCAHYEEVAALLDRRENMQGQFSEELAKSFEELGKEIHEWIEKLK